MRWCELKQIGLPLLLQSSCSEWSKVHLDRWKLLQLLKFEIHFMGQTWRRWDSDCSFTWTSFHNDISSEWWRSAVLSSETGHQHWYGVLTLLDWVGEEAASKVHRYLQSVQVQTCGRVWQCKYSSHWVHLLFLQEEGNCCNYTSSVQSLDEPNWEGIQSSEAQDVKEQWTWEVSPLIADDSSSLQ